MRMTVWYVLIQYSMKNDKSKLGMYENKQLTRDEYLEKIAFSFE